MIAELRARFEKFWNPGAHTRLAWQILFACYGQDPNRHYHNLDHIDHCLRVLDTMPWADNPWGDKDGDREFRRAELAIFFHDAVYVPGDSFNEIASARLLEGMSFLGTEDTQAVIPIATDIIRCTRHHPYTRDMTYDSVFDCDLAILGTTPAVYRGYVDRIRKEYLKFTDDEWTLGRMQFLRAMLASSRIYRRATSILKYEDQARANMTDELASIGKS